MPPSNDDPPAKRARVQDQMTLYDSKDKQIVVADNVRIVLFMLCFNVLAEWPRSMSCCDMLAA